MRQPAKVAHSALAQFQLSYVLCAFPYTKLLFLWNAKHTMLVTRYIDGRVWPERDELEVRLMMDLIRHVTG